MNRIENNKEQRYKYAKKRVNELKGFYWHLAIYVVVNAFIVVNIYIRDTYDGENFWSWHSFATPIFWGIGLGFHALNVFGLRLLFGRDWERRKIKQFMDEEEKYLR